MLIAFLCRARVSRTPDVCNKEIQPYEKGSCNIYEFNYRCIPEIGHDSVFQILYLPFITPARN